MCFLLKLFDSFSLNYFRLLVLLRLLNDFYVSNNDLEENIAWKVGAGASVNITHNLIFDMQYEFVDLGHAQAGNFFRAGGMVGTMEIPMKFDYRTHDFNVGLRYSF